MSKNNLELREGSDNSNGVGARLGRIVGNPDFQDQFNLNFKILYYSGVGNATILPDAIPNELKTKVPVFLFGNSDYQGGFNKIKSFFPLNLWVDDTVGAAIDEYGIFRKEKSSLSIVPCIRNIIKAGDLFFLYTSKIGGVDYFACVIVNCPQVAYGSLLDSINSDVFKINNIRYFVPAANTNQLSNQILLLSKSIFGKTQDDYVDPNLFVTGKTHNTNIADIPLNMEINKYKGIGFYIDYNCVSFNWSVFVESTKKITL